MVNDEIFYTNFSNWIHGNNNHSDENKNDGEDKNDEQSDNKQLETEFFLTTLNIIPEDVRDFY